MLAIALGPKRGGSDAAPEGDDDGDERESFDFFADQAGIPDEKRDDAYEALVSMIQACIKREKAGGYDEES